MRLQSFRITNFRRLKDVHIDLDPATSIFVGPNNSGKTSASQIFRLFFGSGDFSVHDFSAHCWPMFDRIGEHDQGPVEPLPTITLDLWFAVEKADLHRVMPLLPSLDWHDVPLGVRLEYAPKDPETLLSRFHEEREVARAQRPSVTNGEHSRHTWPKTLHDYLEKRLAQEYKVFHYVLDRTQFGEDLQPSADYVPLPLADERTGAAILKSLIRVDFLDAQRNFSDAKAGSLSQRLSRIYTQKFKQREPDLAALDALAQSEAALDEHLALTFADVLKQLSKLGYPGFADPDLVFKYTFAPETIFNSDNARIHYALRDPGTPASPSPTLPDTYNGLGFKSLIYIVLELLDYHQRWEETELDRPLLHMVIIEEPEAHMHAQLQQVFIRQINAILPQLDGGYRNQFVVTTHSPHILHESTFVHIRYFSRARDAKGRHTSNVLNLSNFYDPKDETSAFWLKYMKLIHCDLFFADAAILVEGNVERMLMPTMIERAAPELHSRYLSVLEVGGAFAHIFRSLIEFLGLTTLVITDLDSVSAPATSSELEEDAQAGTDDEDDSPAVKKKLSSIVCMPDREGAFTSNPTLIEWLPKKKLISDLLAATSEERTQQGAGPNDATVHVVYQTLQPVSWAKTDEELAGRTFEVAFALSNLDLCQDVEHKTLRLRVAGASSLAPRNLVERIHRRVHGNGFKKTEFAMAVMMMKQPSVWVVPPYIAAGLRWLEQQLAPTQGASGGEAATLPEVTL